MKNRKMLVLSTLVCLLPMVFGLLVYQKLPESMATHWGSGNVPNGYMSRPLAVFGLPALMAGINLVTWILLDSDPKRKNASKALLGIGKWCVPAISCLMMGFVLLWNLNVTFSMETVTVALVGVLFLVIGNYLPKTKQSYTVGIKLPWTLDSEENWNRTHHLAGYLWMFGGIVMLAGCFVPLGFVLPVVIVLLVVVPGVYSFWLHQKGI